MTFQDLPQIKRKNTSALHFRVVEPMEVRNPFAALGFDDLLAQHPFLPDLTAILGICEDRLPVLLDLTDPKPGSVLIGATHLEGARGLLQLALFSTLVRTPGRGLEVLVLTSDPEGWQPFERLASKHHLEIRPIFERAAGEAILHFGRLLDQRRNGRAQGSVRLMLVDDLNALNHLDFDVQLNFDWLAKEGPQYQTWALAGLQADRVEQNDRHLSAFRTRVLGQIDDPFHATWLAGARPPQTGLFHPTQQFSVRINQNWMNFWLPGHS